MELMVRYSGLELDCKKVGRTNQPLHLLLPHGIGTVVNSKLAAPGLVDNLAVCLPSPALSCPPSPITHVYQKRRSQPEKRATNGKQAKPAKFGERGQGE